MNVSTIHFYRKHCLHVMIAIICFAGFMLFTGCSQSKIYRVGVLSGLNFFAEITDGFKIEMTKIGYVEGKNITYDIQKTDFDMVAYERILKGFVKDKVDLILVFPTEASQQAKAVTKGTNIPVVFTNAFTEDTGLINSIQEPGENITGVRWPGPEIVTRCSEVMLELAPKTKRMWVFYQKGYPIVLSQLKVLRPMLESRHIELVEVPAANPEEIESELGKKTGPFDADVIHIVAEPLVVTPSGYAAVAKFAAKYKIPIGGSPVFEGPYQSLFGLIPNSILQGKQAAYLADKIFKGAPAGKLPVVTAEYNFIFNYKQAEQLKLKVSERLLGQADKVIR